MCVPTPLNKRKRIEIKSTIAKWQLDVCSECMRENKTCANLHVNFA